VQRSYNSKDGTWRIGPGYIRHADELPNHVGPEDDYYPVVVSADGAEHATAGVYGEGIHTYVFMTTEFWRYDRRTHVLQMPNGVAVSYGLKSETSNYRYPLDASDPFGNSIHYNYEPDAFGGYRLTSIVQDLRSSDQVRQVDFAYATGSDLVASVTYGDRTWTYSWSDWKLTGVSLPTGRSWTFTYDYDEQGQDTLTVMMPAGGTVTYTFGLVSFPTTPWKGSRMVLERDSGGRGVSTASWQFAYPQAWQRIITGPANRNLAYEVDVWGDCTKQEIRNGDDVLETQDLVWEAFPVGCDPEVGLGAGPATIVTARSTSRDSGTTYSTEYEYHAHDYTKPGNTYADSELGERRIADRETGDIPKDFGNGV
jgi:YD repeat-containing protein